MSNFTAAQGGKGWYNPMVITLNATAGTGTITDYYVAFYNKTLTQAATSTTFLADVKTKFNNSNKAKDGFLLRYNTTLSKYYVWDYLATTATVTADDSTCNANGCFVDITSDSRQICGKNTSNVIDCRNKLYYTVYPGDSLNKLTPNPNLANTWTVKLDKNFGSKTMYTAVYVTDSNNLAAFNSNITPTY